MDTQTSLYDYVMQRLDSRVKTQREVANGSGVPFSTVTKIAQREVKNPGVKTVQAIADYFKANDSAPRCQCGIGRQADDKHAARST